MVCRPVDTAAGVIYFATPFRFARPLRPYCEFVRPIPVDTQLHNNCADGECETFQLRNATNANEGNEVRNLFSLLHSLIRSLIHVLRTDLRCVGLLDRI